MTRLCTLASVAFCVFAVSSPALAQHGMKPMSDDQTIKSAMAAAPPAVAKNATIVTVNEKGELRTLRKGGNNFTCIADDPSTPGPDPMCMDANGMEWWQAISRPQGPAGRQARLHLHAAGRHRCQQHRSVRDQARAEQQLDRDRRPRDGRRGDQGHDAGLSAHAQAGHVSALCDVARHALRAPDIPVQPPQLEKRAAR